MNTHYFPAAARGTKDSGWLKSRFFFSFSDYYNPMASAFGTLVAFNDDELAVGKGFGTHPHVNMEIISVLLRGHMNHRDSMGYSTEVTDGGVQIMSAGSGLRHEEYNIGQEDVHFLQIWIEPKQRGVRPSYEQKRFSTEDKKGRLRLVASPDGAEGSVRIHQDAWVYASVLDGADAASYSLPAGHKAYVHVARGAVELNGERLSAGDGARISGEAELHFGNAQQAEFLLFDMA